MTGGIVCDLENDRPALIVNGLPVLYYRQLEQKIANLIGKLPKSELFFLIGSNDVPSLLCYLASLKFGAVPLLLSKELASEQLNRLIKTYEPRFVFLSDGVSWNRDGFKEEWRLDDYVFYRRDRVTPKLVHEDLALLLATSGSTGSPKLVRLSLRNLISNAESIIDYLGITANERAITSLPFNYSYGLSVINSYLRAGASLVLTNSSLIDKAFWRQIDDHRVTSFAGVPYSIDILLKLRFGQMDTHLVKTLTLAGGRLSSDKMKQINAICKEKSIRFFSMYGQTEATARIAYLPPEDIESKLGSIGKAIPGGDLWLENETGQRIYSSDTVGELLYAGPNVSLGYAECPDDLMLGDVNQGVLRTGDLARVDKDGYFFIEGRSKRFLKIFGVRISLDGVEEIAARRGWTCAAHGADDQLVLFTVELPEVSSDVLRAEMAGTLGIHPSVVKVRTLPDLPRLDTGKVDYQCLTRML